MVAVTRWYRSSMRVMVECVAARSLLTTQIEPPPTATPTGVPGTESVRTTRDFEGSTRETVASAEFATHSDPPAAVTAEGVSPTGTELITFPVRAFNSASASGSSVGAGLFNRSVAPIAAAAATTRPPTANQGCLRTGRGMRRAMRSRLLLGAGLERTRREVRQRRVGSTFRRRRSP